MSDTIIRRLASGSEAVVDVATGKVLEILPEGWDDEGPTCRICDGLGHGYPGAGPCPLEERGYDDGFAEYEARMGLV